MELGFITQMGQKSDENGARLDRQNGKQIW